MREEETRVWRQVMASAAKLTVPGRISVLHKTRPTQCKMEKKII